MIERYQRKELKEIWGEKSKFDAWLKVEILACKAWGELGLIPQDDIKAIEKNARYNIDDIYEIEQQTKHDVIAFTRALSLNMGDEKKWIHYGLTSTDVVDTANGYLLKQVNEILKKDLQTLLNTTKDLALKHKNSVCMGRTHGIHAELTTFGLKVLTFYSELKRNIKRFENACSGVEAGKISGAVGTFANTPMFVEEYVCKHLGINAQEISTQVLPRDLHAEYFSSIALIGSACERFATEIRALAKTETREVEEGFAKGQKGSSAMPHKRNPIGCENICGLARVLRGYMLSSYENIALWHERDISHSSTERIMLPDATSLLDYMLNRFNGILLNLSVNTDTMKANINRSFGLVFSGRVLLELIENCGLSREKAYDLVQPKAMKSWELGVSFKELLKEDEEIKAVLNEEQIENIFDTSYHLKNVDAIFERVLDEKN